MNMRMVLALALAAGALSGCFFLDDESGDPRERIRGYTYCGEFTFEEVWCSPGQYCEDTTFSECGFGCLSDVNCASNQFCDVPGQGELGTCRNAFHSTVGALESDAGLGADAGWGGDAEL